MTPFEGILRSIGSDPKGLLGTLQLWKFGKHTLKFRKRTLNFRKHALSFCKHAKREPDVHPTLVVVRSAFQLDAWPDPLKGLIRLNRTRNTEIP